MRIKLIFFLIGLFLLVPHLSGCGFHLRGSQTPYTYPFQTVTICPDDYFDPIYKELRYNLEAKKIKVLSKDCPNTPRIIILNHKFIERPFAYGADGEIRCETLTLEMEYEYEYYSNNQKKTRRHTIIVRRFRQLNIKQNLADMAEKAIIEDEMIVDVVQQLLVQLTV